MDVSVIIVTYNSAKEIQACLDSVLIQHEVDFDVFVIDNQSQDNTLEKLAPYRNYIRVIESSENLGFGKANNFVTEQASGRYFYFLNPDAVFTSDLDLAHMLQYMEANPQVGLAGSQLYEDDGHKSVAPQKHYPRQQHVSSDFSQLPGEIAWVMGASMMVRRNVFAKVNGFDEDYFLYGEEVDLCLRIRKAGFTIGVNDAVMVKHIGGASERTTGIYEYHFKKQKALHLFFQKHYREEDVLALLKKDIYKARWRLFILSLQRVFGKKNNSKKQRYQAILDSSKEQLRSYGFPPTRE